MKILENLQPKEVFYFFEEISQIPHGSGNMDQISNYLVEFAKSRGLEYYQDAVKNVIIIKEATPGYEEEPALIIQGHMDMVAVSKPELSIDMTKEPLKLAIDGDNIYAEGTSLGGDDGIAVAYGLALLDCKELKHPRLEIVMTVDEETGMDGAREIDLSMLKGKRLLNVDSEDEEVFLTSCAGGARCKVTLAVEPKEMSGVSYDIKVGGLQGGHSGGEIHKEGGNANLLLVRALNEINEKINYGLCKAEGGVADNAIPREATATIIIKEEDEKSLQEIMKAYEGKLQIELAVKDKDVFVESKKVSKEELVSCIAGADLDKSIAMLYALPAGVQAYSADINGLVETSLNLGVLKISNTKVKADYSVRSSVESSKEALLDKIKAVVRLASGECEVSSVYPGWAYRANSPYRDKMTKVYEEMFGKNPKIEAIHGGLECGLLASKIEDLDCISFGPNMQNIHTTEETLSISSTEKVWLYLKKLLETKDGMEK